MGAKANTNPLNHDKTATFGELTGTATDAQIPAAIARDSEVTSGIATHAGIADAHHARYTDAEAVVAMGTKSDTNPLHHDKTTSFSALTGTATDAQIPNNITINYAASAGDADTVDGAHAAALEESAEIDADIATHAGIADAHHARYTDAEAVAAMGVKANTNPLNHDKTTSFSGLTGTATDAQIPAAIARDTEVDSKITAHTTIASAHHTKTTTFTELTGTASDAQIPATIARDSEVTSQVNAHTAIADAHHPRYTDSEAVAAMGAKASTNPLNHDKTASFSELTGTLSEGQIPASIARDAEIMPTVLAGDGPGSTLNADLLDGINSTGFAAAAHMHDGIFWERAGNSGTSPPLDFLGTLDNQPLELRVNGVRALRLEPGPDTSYPSPNLIGGHAHNWAASWAIGATIAGGGSAEPGYGPNRVTDHYGTIGGGANNQTGNNTGGAGGYTTIGGGRRNTTESAYTTVGGGSLNTASVDGATISGGMFNWATAYTSTVGGGYENTASGPFGTVSGGQANTAGARGAVGGGFENTASGPNATVSGGEGNTAAAWHSAVGGGLRNAVWEEKATIGGGVDNTAHSLAAAVGGGEFNDVWGQHATVGGGYDNTCSGSNSTVGGGRWNVTSGDEATVSGGNENSATQTQATVGGGWYNRAEAQWATIGGGTNNVANADAATVGGGEDNRATGLYATVGGGEANWATGRNSTVPGGNWNRATGDYSFAAGLYASANYDGSFVWADASPFGEFAAPRDNCFRVRAMGGAAFITTSGAWVEIWGNDNKLIRASNGASLSWDGKWLEGSDRDAKENFARVNRDDVLRRVAELPITTWNYKAGDAHTRHMGPVAQDFYAAFGLGQDDKTIANADATGVALAAIQGLHKLVQEKDAKISSLESRIEALETLVEKLVESQVGGGK